MIFFKNLYKINTCVWQITRMTLQYFFMVLKSFSIAVLPSSSPHRLEALENAFFLDLHLYVQTSMGMVDETEEGKGEPDLIGKGVPSGEKALHGKLWLEVLQRTQRYNSITVIINEQIIFKNKPKKMLHYTIFALKHMHNPSIWYVVHST